MGKKEKKRVSNQKEQAEDGGFKQRRHFQLLPKLHIKDPGLAPRWCLT